MRIALASDHAGALLKLELVEYVNSLGHEALDLGGDPARSSDYPEAAFAVAEGVVRGTYDRGILVCGSGIGMSIAANKVRGIRAALCHEGYSARMSRDHNDANVLCLGQRVTGIGLAKDIVQIFIETPFSHGVNHERRMGQVHDYETTGATTDDQGR
ncbi:MAG: ribose 5-phosphate isomerase B [Anaerolineae bacterium]